MEKKTIVGGHHIVFGASFDISHLPIGEQRECDNKIFPGIQDLIITNHIALA